MTFHELHFLGMSGDLWERVRGLGSETWKWFHRQSLYVPSARPFCESLLLGQIQDFTCCTVGFE